MIEGKDEGNNPDGNQVQDAGQVLTFRVSYHVGKGALWGNYDFWTGVLSSLAAAYIFALTNRAVRVLAREICRVLKSARAETDKFESCRFDLLLPAARDSWMVLRFMREATFRGGETFSEDDIHNAIVAVVGQFNGIANTNPSEAFLVSAELRNHGKDKQVAVRKYDGKDWVAAIMAQASEAESGETLTIRF